MIYTVSVKGIIYYSKRKLDAIYKHVSFRYRDKAKYREATETQFQSMKRKAKKVVEL